ncbi:MAG TPA: hypothetical protein VIF60_14380 [Burkholderiaceae bacterium]|jgi:hypothetical protein
MKGILIVRLVVNLLWVSFLVAVLAEGCFFSVFDPEELLHLTQRLDWSPLSGYTIGFFFFWSIGFVASVFTYFLINLPNERLVSYLGYESAESEKSDGSEAAS